ncbi:Sap, sulfolipid-1-addressing protein [Frankineae bacterium MT45]|nr:Sap, sulfolipid-1-addressing protein [Frankineae bacterium MT45]
MGAAIGSMLGFAAGVAVSPLPIVAIILLLATPKGRVTGSLFALGWVVGLAALGGVVLALAGPADASTDGGPAKWTGWLELILGLLLLLFAVKQWRERPDAGAEPPTPSWMASLDTLTPVKSLGLGALLATVNPKNGTLTIAAAASIAATGAAAGAQLVAIAIFVVIGSVGVLAPLAVYLFAGQSAVTTLEGWRHWFIHNNAAIMAVLFLVIGLKLIGDAITVLT